MNHLQDYALFEGKQLGTLYHTTTLFGLQRILEDGYFNGSRDEVHSDVSFVSTTRNPRNLFKDIVKMSLDGDKISNRFKVVPVHYFNAIYKGHEHRPLGDVFQNQQEERVLLKSDEALEWAPYLIDVCVNTQYISHMEEHTIREILVKMGVRHSFVEDRNELAKHRP